MSDILDALDEIDEDFDVDEILDAEVLDPVDDDIVEQDMTEDEAREVTDAIRSAATATYALLLHAHEGKAYKALGYDTWADYVQTEFDMSKQRSYQLMDFGRAVAMIESATPEGTVVKLTEAQARDIKRELPKITEHLSESTKDKTPEEASAEVDEMINDIREQKKAEDKEKSKKQDAEDAEAQEAYQKSLEDAANALLGEDDDLADGDEGSKPLDADRPEGLTSSADDGLIDIPIAGDGDMDPDAAVHLYNFFNMLETVKSLPEPDDFVNVVPSSRAEEVNKNILEVAQWVNRFQTLWESREGL